MIDAIQNIPVFYGFQQDIFQTAIVLRDIGIELMIEDAQVYGREKVLDIRFDHILVPFCNGGLNYFNRPLP